MSLSKLSLGGNNFGNVATFFYSVPSKRWHSLPRRYIFFFWSSVSSNWFPTFSYTVLCINLAYFLILNVSNLVFFCLNLTEAHSYTVTRIDMILRYPDRVPLTHFVHRAKKVFSMGAWILCWVFCATGIFRRCNGKMFEHRGGANLRPSDYEADTLPLRHCSLVQMI